MKFIKSLVQQTRQTQRVMTDITLGAAGWKAGQISPEVLQAPQVYLYVWDQPTQWVWMCSVPREGFAKVTLQALRDKAGWAAIRSGVGQVIGRVADGAPPGPLEGLDWETQLGLLLSGYAGTTQVWEYAKRMATGGHFIVLNYRPAGQVESMLRPFIVPGETDGAMPVEGFNARVAEVLRMDLARHPEWFQAEQPAGARS